MRLRKYIMIVMMLAILFCATVAVAPEKVLAEGEEQPVYHAAMGIQTATQIWIQRWGYYEGSKMSILGRIIMANCMTVKKIFMKEPLKT